MCWMVYSVCHILCMVVNINALFAERRITELLSDIVTCNSFCHGIHYSFPDTDAVTSTFHALVHPIYLVIFNNFLFFNFFFQFGTIISFSLDKYSLLIFDVLLHYQLNAFKIPKMVQYNHKSLMISVNDAKYIHHLPIFRISQSFLYCKLNHS